MGQKLRFSGIILCFLICLAACSSPKGDPLKYRSQGFSATVSVESERTKFDAIFHVSAPAEDQSIGFKVDFIAPESLKGLSISQDNEGGEILLGEEKYTKAVAGSIGERNKKELLTEYVNSLQE